MTHPHELLSQDPHDRIGIHRKDPDWLEAAWADPRTRVLVVAGTRVRPVGGEVEWVAPDTAPDGVRVLLGEREGAVYFAVLADRSVAAEDPRSWVPLRGLLPVLTEPTRGIGDAALVLHAFGIAEWQASVRFCPRCGEPLESRAAGHELACANGHTQFPRTDPAVIMLISDGEPGSPDERCLMGRQAVWPTGRYSTLAGFYEPGESLEDTVRREVAEEVGVVVGDVTYFGNQPWPLPASLMLGFFGRATHTEIQVDEVEIEAARWFTRAEMLAEATAGTLVLPGGVSISRSLVEEWYGGPLPGSW